MYYEINVSKNGHHFFATAERSLRDVFKLRPVLTVLTEKFPESEGYSVGVTRINNTGTFLDVGDILKGGSGETDE